MIKEWCLKFFIQKGEQVNRAKGENSRKEGTLAGMDPDNGRPANSPDKHQKHRDPTIKTKEINRQRKRQSALEGGRRNSSSGRKVREVMIKR